VIDFHKELVSALSAVLPTHYEMALTSNTKTPCISYMETNNYSVTETIGASLGYSRVTYQVKIWGNDIATIQEYAAQVDEALRPLGFKRIASGELHDYNSTMLQKILTYEALASEYF
jgi:hypothetical protein